MNQQTWEIELSGTPTEVIHEADIGQLVKTLQESENEVPEDTKTRILELLSGSKIQLRSVKKSQCSKQLRHGFQVESQHREIITRALRRVIPLF